jgi:hypothetical protein
MDRTGMNVSNEIFWLSHGRHLSIPPCRQAVSPAAADCHSLQPGRFSAGGKLPAALT